jgi:ADP-L-glycero-D-manno-heptose 6-epimerase
MMIVVIGASGFIGFNYLPMPKDLRGRYQYFTQARIEKLRSAGFTQPIRSIEEGVRQYVQTHLLGEARAA